LNQHRALEEINKPSKKLPGNISGHPRNIQSEGVARPSKPFKEMTSKEYWNYLVEAGLESGPVPRAVRDA